MTKHILPTAEALAIIRSGIQSPGSVKVPLHQSLGKVLAEPITAADDQPPCDQSSIDGFAMAAESLPGTYRLTGEWLPGSPAADSAPLPGEAVRVYTGTPLPTGCTLIMLEDTGVDKDSLTLQAAPSASLIRRRGKSVQRGAPLLEEGVVISPGEIALLASTGIAQPAVTPLPRILHLTTGREIVDVACDARPWQIRNSNAPLIQAMLSQCGYPDLSHRHIDESMDAMADALDKADDFDILLVSGGASVGKYDNTASALKAAGFDMLFHGINLRPGKPLLFARRNHQWAFGIPGNPVSHFAVFHAFIRPALDAFSRRPSTQHIRAILREDTAASDDPRETLWPATLSIDGDGLSVYPKPWIHSGDMAALRRVNALIHYPQSTRARAGDSVTVIPCQNMPG